MGDILYSIDADKMTSTEAKSGGKNDKKQQNSKAVVDVSTVNTTKLRK